MKEETSVSSFAFMESVHQRRLRLLRMRLAAARAEAIVVNHPANMFYLSGFTGSTGVLVVEEARAALFTDGRYKTQAPEEVRDARVRICGGSLLKAIGSYLRASRARRLAFEAAHLTVAQKTVLKASSGAGKRWVGLGNTLEALRSIKDEQEIETMRAAAALGSAVFEEILPLVKPGVLEIELAAEIEHRMRRRGARGPAFETIVASGARSALPHAHPTSKALRRNELVVLDLGAILRHYCCDLTRTVYLGRAPGRVRRWYHAVREAQVAARETLRPGVTAGDVDRAARRVLRRSGLARHFLHSTGHGLGLEVHEEPKLARGQKQLIEAGHVVTVEPGVYFEGVGGIRIEDNILVTAGGNESLTTASRELLQL